MSTTITHSSGTITPDFVDGYEATRAGGTRVHPPIGAVFPDVTHRPASARSGRLVLVFFDEGTAFASYEALSAPETFTLTSTDRASIDMSFVVPEGGDLAITLNRQSRRSWEIAVSYQEVAS